MKNKYRTIFLTLLITILTMFHMTMDVKAAYQKAENSVEISSMSVYKDMDTSFLKEFPFGSKSGKEAKVQFTTAEEMIGSDSKKLTDGKLVQTQGFYSAGDGGAAVYLICEKEPDSAIALSNGLYAQLIPDIKTIDGKKWAIISILQFGAKGDGKQADQFAINSAIGRGGAMAKEEEVFRSLVYIPKGEYRCENEIQCNVQKVNVVGEGDQSVLFTDNNYRKDLGYAEFFFQAWNAEQLYLGDFRIEAREVDYKKYMRQVAFIYCSDVYLYQVDMIVPQEAISGFYFEDRQYTNLTFYSGNKNMTADSCYLSQMSGSYRGANIGIMDIYSTGEQNITVMNCELHDNARDEQVGMFSGLDREKTYIKNVDFINNTMYTYQPPNLEASGGWRTMCFTVAYNESTNMDNIHIAGNHFISEVDSKFMTFGNVTNCVVENNMIEMLATNGNFGYGFESGNSNAENIKIRNNEIYLSTRKGETGGKTMLSGPATFTGNKIVSDAVLTVGYDRGIYNNNTVVSVGTLSEFAKNVTEVNNNQVTVYGSMGNFWSLAGSFTREDGTVNLKKNNIVNYQRESKRKGVWDSLNNINGGFVKTIFFTDNRYLAPNKKYWDEPDRNQMVNTFYLRGYGSNLASELYMKNNTLQGVKDFVAYDAGDTASYVKYEGNTIKDYTYEENIPICTEIQITQDGTSKTDIFTTSNKVSLGTLVKAGVEAEDGTVTDIKKVTDKEIVWCVSCDGLASVEKGVVKRKNYGDVTIYTLPTDGSGVYGKCVIHFSKKVATAVTVEKEKLTMQPGYVHDVVYEVVPETASKTLQWSSSNPQVAEVTYDGTIKAISTGTANITCSTLDGSNISRVIKVTVEPLTVKKINLDKSYYEFEEAMGTVQLKVASFVPADATNLTVGKWMSTNDSIATVDQNGLVTAKGQGVAEIRAYTTDGLYYGSCSIYVKPEKIKDVSVSYGNTWAKFTWEKQENVYGYYIYRYHSEKGEWENIATVTENHYEAWNLTADTDYQYRITSYIARWDSSGQKHNYENLSDTIKFHTDDKEYIKTLTKVPEAIGVAIEEPKDVTFYYKKEDLTISSEDETILSAGYRPGSEGLWNIEERLQGLKKGRTNLIIKANDGGGFETKIPVLVREYDSIGDDFTLTGEVQALKLRWKVTDTESITGFSLYIWPDDTIYIPMKDITVETEADGTKYCTYLYEGLKENMEYRIQVAPYVEQDGYKFEGPLSTQRRATTLAYTDEEDKSETTENENTDMEKVFVSDNVKSFRVSKNNTDKVTLKWSSYENATGYQIYVYKSSKWKLLKNIKSGTTKSCIVQKLVAGTSYKFRICAYAEGSNGKICTSKYTNLSVMTLPKKTEIKKVSAGSSKVKLQWKKVKCDGYQIQYSTTKKFTSNVKKSDVSNKKTSCSIGKLKKNKKYYVRIRAYVKVNGKKSYGTWSKVKVIKVS